MEKDRRVGNVGAEASKLAAKGAKEVFHWIPKHLYLASVLFLAVAIYYFGNSKAWGENLGGKAGEAVGWAVGSFHGVTEGWGAGSKAGKEAGLSAEDTVVRISTKLQETRKLQVLQVKIRLTDMYKQGENGKDYAALYRIEGTGEFTVDLAQAVVHKEGDRQVITIPRPEFTPYLDDSTWERIAEYPPGRSFKGDARDGAEGYLNSRERLEEKAKTGMLGYDTMMEQAEQTALEQVKLLAESVCGNGTIIEVYFEEEGE